MVVRIQRGLGPGKWRRVGDLTEITCPWCLLKHTLSHDIDDRGHARPDLACPTQGCYWRVSAVLEGWVP